MTPNSSKKLVRWTDNKINLYNKNKNINKKFIISVKLLLVYRDFCPFFRVSRKIPLYQPMKYFNGQFITKDLRSLLLQL